MTQTPHLSRARCVLLVVAMSVFVAGADSPSPDAVATVRAYADRRDVRVWYSWIARAAVEAKSAAKPLNEVYAAILFGAPDFTYALAQGGLADVSKEAAKKTLVKVAKRILEHPSEAARRVADREYALGLKAYRENYAVMKRFQDGEVLSEEDARRFMRNEVQVEKMIAANQLIRDINNREFNDWDDPALKAGRAVAYSALERIAEVEGRAGEGQLASIAIELHEVVESSRLPLNDYPPYRDYLRRVRDAERKWDRGHGRQGFVPAGVPAWAKISTLQIREAGKAGVPPAVEVDLGSGVTMRMVFVPSGSFLMGSPAGEKDRMANEGPRHSVEITRGFYIGVTEVTRAQWRAVMGKAPRYWRGDLSDRAANHVSWEECEEFTDRLNEKTGCRGFSLPTEAQWEYACRAGTTTRFWYGNDEKYTDLGNHAWFGQDRHGAEPEPHSVGQKGPNPWGLYEVHGNVAEWCSDFYGRYAAGEATDPTGPATGKDPVVRSGHWYVPARYCRSAARDEGKFRSTSSAIGFSCVRTISPFKSRPPFEVPPTGGAASKPEGDHELAHRRSESARPPEMPSDAKVSREQIEYAHKIGVPVTEEIRLGRGVVMKLVLIKPGTFLMGSPRDEKGRFDDETQHRVRLTKPFYMAFTEVTQAQWQAVMGVKPPRLPGHFEGANLPVGQVSWNDCQAFLRQLDQKIGGGEFRLPTEAEWEYACRAGTRTAYHWGDSPNAGKGWCNASDLAAKKDGLPSLRFQPTFDWSDGHPYTAPVGTFRPNTWGLYDMHGNVWEWCSDRAGEYPVRDVTDPQGPDAGTQRVARGGSWSDQPRNCRSAVRMENLPTSRSFGIGLRCVRTIRLFARFPGRRDTRRIVINVTGRGEAIVTGESLTLEQLGELLTSAKRDHPSLYVLVKMAKDAPKARLESILGICKKSGVSEPFTTVVIPR